MKILLKIGNYEKGVIIERLNRFVVKGKIKNKNILAHLNNTGRLEDFLKKGKIGLFLPINADYADFTRTARTKVKFRLSMIQESKNIYSIIDTQLQMKCFEIALEKGYISWLKGAKILKRNFKINNSLIDYLIQHKNKNYLLEVKSAVMKYKNFAMYPDCPSIRGQKHIRDLIDNHKNSVILFIAGMKNISAFSPNKNADPKIYELLKIAKNKGVKIKAIQIYFDEKRKSVILKNDDLLVVL
jgi:sugar fermentation stimulation protein A